MQTGLESQEKLLASYKTLELKRYFLDAYKSLPYQ